MLSARHQTQKPMIPFTRDSEKGKTRGIEDKSVVARGSKYGEKPTTKVASENFGG